MKNPLNLVNGVLLLMALCELVAGNECTQRPYTGPQDVSMCEIGTHLVTAVYLSASSADMGEGSRCTCTMVALSPASNGSFFALNQTPRVSHCSAVLTVRGSSQAQYTCQTNAISSTQVTMNASDVTIEVLRNDSVDFGFCVILADVHLKAGNTFNLTCGNDRPLVGSITASTVRSTLTSTSLSTSKAASSSSPPESTASSSKTTTPVVTSSTRGTRDSSGETMTVPRTSGPTPVTGEGTGTSPAGPDSDKFRQSQPAFPTAAVVAGVSGAVNVVLVVVVVVLCCRQRRRKGQAPARETEDNSHYAGLSDVTRVAPQADPAYDVIGAQSTAAV